MIEWVTPGPFSHEPPPLTQTPLEELSIKENTAGGSGKGLGKANEIIRGLWRKQRDQI